MTNKIYYKKVWEVWMAIVINLNLPIGNITHIYNIYISIEAFFQQFFYICIFIYI